MQTKKETKAWPKQKHKNIKKSDISLKTLLKNANKRCKSEAEGYRSNPTDGNSRL